MSTKTIRRFSKKVSFALVGSLFALAFVAMPSPARAHCDTLDGPVVKAARAALEKRDVSAVLWWVKKDAEVEVTAAFKKTLAVRGKSAEARELADTWFFETVVRLHRAGEGAPFNGLKPAGANMPHAVAAADKALEGGLPVDKLAKLVSAAVEEGVKKRFAETVERKKLAPTSVEAGREFVESYVGYVHYVEGLASLAEGHGGHGDEEGATRAAHAD